MANQQQFCTFFLEDQFFGVPVQQVQEVIRYQAMTRVPLVPEVIRGLINLRGQIVMALDLRRRLGMKDRPESQLPMNVGRALRVHQQRSSEVLGYQADFDPQWRCGGHDQGVYRRSVISRSISRLFQPNKSARSRGGLCSGRILIDRS